MPNAVVSGLGPNGLLAALELRARGYAVTAIERRPNYARTIHLSLRRSWLDAVAELEPALSEKLLGITSPIEAFQHLVADAGGEPRPAARPNPPAAEPRGTGIAARLEQPALVHVRLDELERVFRAHLAGLPGVDVRSGAELALVGTAPFGVQCGGVGLEPPDLIVVAEGGKSPTARALGRSMLKLSAPRFYISVHVDHALGPITRRLDTAVEVAGSLVPVSFWATGHGKPGRGTWVVLEIPEAVHAGRPSHTFDRPYYERWAAALLGLERAPDPSPTGFSGTFRFEQQLLPAPIAGQNLVFFGDAAGMGHHALGTGLELGACDALALRQLVREPAAIEQYSRALVRSRVELLAYGMKEYYRDLSADPTPWLDEAVQRGTREPLLDVRALIEARLAKEALGGGAKGAAVLTSSARRA